MKNHQTLEALEKILADSYVLMLKTQNYHWNVVGDNFKSLHEMFQLQYEELFGAIDELAERIRSLGSKVDGTFDHFKKYSDIKSGNKDFNAQEMIKDLISDHEIIVNQLHKSIKISQQEGDESSADIFIQRAKAHEKTIWMLVASL
ncbi:MAG: DNA starvation/stationary phase protection protein [Alphaproteobacteria bacterium]|nr:DNA starvation/stationary phase protection protein [Alphaproteobacteria bacterium]